MLRRIPTGARHCSVEPDGHDAKHRRTRSSEADAAAGGLAKLQHSGEEPGAQRIWRRNQLRIAGFIKDCMAGNTNSEP
jgi:hypothetical protein